jgi:exonuclease III
MFWNLQRKPLQDLVASVARNYDVDILILAECLIPSQLLLVALNESHSHLYDYASHLSQCDKIHIFTRFHRDLMPVQVESSRTTIRRLILPEAIDILVAATHFPSKRDWKESSQIAECSELANLIRKAEELVGHLKTILVGDLNMNPFEVGVVNANGLHGVMSRQIAEKRTRTVQNSIYPFFYNPMWGLLGDAAGLPGTFYRSNSEHTEFFWYMFDQVLIRPDLMNRFRNSDLQILNTDGKTSLLTSSGIPNKNIASDHLPILFSLDL